MYNIVLPYIIILFTFLFTKERILINQEFLIIFGFLLTFFLLKTLVQHPLVEALNTYANDIRKTFTDVLTFVKQKANLDLDNNAKISINFINYVMYKQYSVVMVPVARCCNLLRSRRHFSKSKKLLAYQLVEKIQTLRKKYYLCKFDYSAGRLTGTLTTKKFGNVGASTNRYNLKKKKTKR